MTPLQLSKSLLAAAFTLSLAISAVSFPSLANNRNELRQGLPGRRISGGVRDSRANCFTSFDQSLVAIIPQSNLGKTASPRPTFWFSVPETEGSKSGEFKLYDPFGELVYYTSVDMSDDYGLSEFQLPESAPALVLNEEYQWVFTMACEGASAHQLGLSGQVLRVNLSDSAVKRINEASPEDRVSLYAAAGLWQEQVTELVALRRSNINNMDFQLEWAALIQSTGLTSYVSSHISEAMSAAQLPASTAGTDSE
ncbi:MAG: DUF928 domain-containing protein [Phormidesmis sp.]